jgi:hypothetical protein
MSEAFFRRVEEHTFLATESTRGPWSIDHQHGGPPAALAGRAMESIATAIGTPTPMRFTLELLRPVPIGRLAVVAEASPEGRGVRRIHASINVEGVEVLRAEGLFAATRPVDVETSSPADPPPPPDRTESIVFPFFRWSVGYHTSMELRYARGTLGDPHVFAWMKMRVPLVEGETPSPTQRVLVAADSGNGVTAALDWRTHSFVNPDLTVALQRLPDGEWVGLDAEMATNREGVGLASTVIWDERGVVGRGLQTLLVRRVG